MYVFVYCMRWPSRSYTCTSCNTFRSWLGWTAKFKYGGSAIGAERPILFPNSIYTYNGAFGFRYIKQYTSDSGFNFHLPFKSTRTILVYVRAHTQHRQKLVKIVSKSTRTANCTPRHRQPRSSHTHCAIGTTFSSPSVLLLRLGAPRPSVGLRERLELCRVNCHWYRGLKTSHKYK